MELGAFVSLALIVAVWFAFYFLAVFFKLERFGLELHPLYFLTVLTTVEVMISLMALKT